MADVDIKGLAKRFGETAALEDVSLSVADGEFCVLVGPSGCGKTTLLRIIAGLETETEGSLSIGGADAQALAPARRGIAMVFQSYALYPHMTAYRNMSFGLKFQKVSRPDIDERVRSVAEMLGISDLLHRKPAELSGGQRQRVAIGRAIVRNPKVFLFDEPLSNLDAALRATTRLEIARLHKALGATMIYVTHDQAEAMTLADKMVVMKDGRIEQIGTPLEVYRKPANLFVAGFLGHPKINIVTGAIAAEYGAASIGLRPEHLTLSPSGKGYAARVVHVEPLGSEAHVHLRSDALGPLILRAPSDFSVSGDGDLHVTFERTRVLLFDENGNAIN